jgi:hypothetical protein
MIDKNRGDHFKFGDASKSIPPPTSTMKSQFNYKGNPNEIR